jgi:hypothetical protein
LILEPDFLERLVALEKQLAVEFVQSFMKSRIVCG